MRRADAPPIDHHGKPPELPLYRQIAAAIRTGIAAGDPPVGDALPGEEDLARRFGASRYTVRAALRLLEEDGLILRRTGARSTVLAARRQEVFTQTIVNLRQILNYPPDTRRSNSSTGYVETDETLAALLECEVGRSWFRIEAVRRSPRYAQPLCWTEIYLLPQYAAVARRPDHEQTHVYEQVERQFGEAIERAQVEITPGVIPASAAAELEVAAGTPALVVVRRYLRRDGQSFEVTRSWHPLDRYVFSMEFHRRPSQP